MLPATRLPPTNYDSSSSIELLLESDTAMLSAEAAAVARTPSLYLPTLPLLPPTLLLPPLLPQLPIPPPLLPPPLLPLATALVAQADART